MYTKILADKYQVMKKRHEEAEKEFGISPTPYNAVPVDMNGGFVAFNTSQEAKEGNENMEKSHKCNLERFGLLEDGVL